jgi:hypothetical protein
MAVLSSMEHIGERMTWCIFSKAFVVVPMETAAEAMYVYCWSELAVSHPNNPGLSQLIVLDLTFQQEWKPVDRSLPSLYLSAESGYIFAGDMVAWWTGLSRSSA